jgi:diguanylate cyclase (GGDEF)-like protein
MVSATESDATIDQTRLPAERHSGQHLATTLKGKHLPAADSPLADSHGWCLVVITGSAIGQRVEVSEKPLLIGRSPECGWVLQGGGLSRRHCAIWSGNGRLWIRDLGSTNGIFVNGTRVPSGELTAGDEVALGDAVFRVLLRQSVEDSYHAVMTERAYLDELTGLGNRRRFQALLEAGVVQAALHREVFSLVLIDLDDFKGINDRHGHDVGDDVLRSCAAQLRSITRSPGGLARIGGEEFAAILQGTDTACAASYAERCRKAIAEMEFLNSGQMFGLSASFGVASWQSDMADCAALVRVADERLYAAKRAGKNRVVSS